MGHHNGSWSPIYGQAWDHPKTRRAVAFLLEREKRIPPDCAPFLVLGWLNRVNVWCLSNSEQGRTSGLSNARLATIAWPEGLEHGRTPERAGGLIRETLRAGGFLEVANDGERVHQFAEFHSRVLYERKRYRSRHDGGDDDGGDSGGPSTGHSGGHSGGESTGETAGTPADTPRRPERTGTERNGTENPPSPRGASPDVPRGAMTPLAQELAKRLGSTLKACQRQVRALRASGHSDREILAAIDRFARPGMAPWEWTKAATPAESSAGSAPDFARDLAAAKAQEAARTAQSA